MTSNLLNPSPALCRILVLARRGGQGAAEVPQAKHGRPRVGDEDVGAFGLGVRGPRWSQLHNPSRRFGAVGWWQLFEGFIAGHAMNFKRE